MRKPQIFVEVHFCPQKVAPLFFFNLSMYLFNATQIISVHVEGTM